MIPKMIEPVRTTARITSKIPLTKMVYEIKLLLEKTTDFSPGQYVQIWIQPGLWRIYSIVEIRKNEVTLLIDLRPGGDASRIWPQVEVGQVFPVLLPMGGFALESSDRPIIFLTTGTGVAPCLPMIRQLVATKYPYEVKLLFGSAYQTGDFVYKYLSAWQTLHYKKFTYIPCFSRESQTIKGEIGRVNKVLWEMPITFTDYDYYICGAPQMISEMITDLENHGVQTYFYEKYA